MGAREVGGRGGGSGPEREREGGKVPVRGFCNTDRFTHVRMSL